MGVFGKYSKQCPNFLIVHLLVPCECSVAPIEEWRVWITTEESLWHFTANLGPTDGWRWVRIIPRMLQVNSWIFLQRRTSLNSWHDFYACASNAWQSQLAKVIRNTQDMLDIISMWLSRWPSAWHVSAIVAAHAEGLLTEWTSTKAHITANCPF